MFSDEEIFVYDIVALKEIIANATTPNLLRASGILRRLLTDNGPLIHKVAGKRDFKIKFKLKNKLDFPDSLKENLTHLWTSNDPSEFPGIAVREVSLDQFLASEMAMLQGSSITVKQIINYVANVGGGVHQGLPKDKDNAKIIHDNNGHILLEGKPYPLASLFYISRIVVEALSPLYEQLRA